MRNFKIIVKNLIFYKPLRSFGLLLLLCLIGLFETYLISGVDNMYGLLMVGNIKTNFDNKLFLFFFTALLIGPLKILFFHFSGKYSIDFTSDLSGKLASFQVMRWKPNLFNASKTLTTNLITELDLLANDNLQSFWSAILAVFSIVFITIFYSLKIGFAKIFSIALLLLILITCGSWLVFPFTKSRATSAALFKAKISGIVVAVANSIRSLNLINSSMSSISNILKRYEKSYREPLLAMFVLQSGIKIFVDYGPYLIIAIFALFTILFNQTLNSGFINFLIKNLVLFIVAFQRLLSYSTMLYNSLYVVFSTTPRLGNTIYYLKNKKYLNLYKNNFASHNKLNKNLHEDFAIIFKSGSKTFLGNEELHVNIGTFKLINNSFVGISAPSGSGKSTFFDILLGFLDLDLGEYFIESRNQIIQSDISYLEQKPILFFENIISNIFMKQVNTIEDIQPEIYRNLLKLIEDLNVKKFVDKIGLFTDLGNGCESLSGGEKQLVCLLRIMIRDPKIIILDEPTASLDLKYRQIIIEQLKKSSKLGKLVIMSSHNKDDFEFCDFLLTKKSVSKPFQLNPLN